MPPHHSHDGPEHDDSKPGPRDDPRPENRHEHADRPGGAGADAERKRAEYLFDTWDGGDISRPDGLVRVAAGVDHEDLHRELLVKFRAEQVDAYELSSLEAPATPDTRTVEGHLPALDYLEAYLRRELDEFAESR